jgi:hypothetical protein
MRVSLGLALGLIPLMGVPTVVQAQSIEALFRQGSAAAAGVLMRKRKRSGGRSYAWTLTMGRL